MKIKNKMQKTNEVKQMGPHQRTLFPVVNTTK